jgi:Xaa-Pro aminopeptidase
MRMKNTALLTGPYDWDPELLPLAEFEARLAAVRRVLTQSGATALLVHGNSVEHGALAYLTSFVPKLGPAFALIPQDGPIRILASGGPGMMRSAKLLTWVEDVRPLGNLRNSLVEWLDEIVHAGRAALGVWGGSIMAQRPYLAVAAAMEPFGKLVEMDDPLDALRRRKSARELILLREACRILAVACDAFEHTAADGSGARTTALAGESAAFAAGAQDVRILASVRNGGPPLPFDGPADIRVTPLLACLAVRIAGYWAEGLVTTASASGGALARAGEALNAMLKEVRPGATSSDLFRAAAEHLPPYNFHPSLEPAIGNGIGLSFEESPMLARDEESSLEDGGVYTIRAGAIGEGSDNAIVSAMIAVDASGIDVLWAATERFCNGQGAAEEPR